MTSGCAFIDSRTFIRLLFFLLRTLHEISAQLFLLFFFYVKDFFFSEILEGFKSQDIFSNCMALEFPFLCIHAISKPMVAGFARSLHSVSVSQF